MPSVDRPRTSLYDSFVAVRGGENRRECSETVGGGRTTSLSLAGREQAERRWVSLAGPPAKSVLDRYRLTPATESNIGRRRRDDGMQPDVVSEKRD
jgi:hypothetical protein